MSDYIFQPGEYVTRDGRRFRLLSTMGLGEFPLIGQVESVQASNHWMAVERRIDGTCGFGAGGDIMPPKQYLWLNLYAPKGMPAGVVAHRTKEDAMKYANIGVATAIGRRKIEITPGVWDE